MSHRWKTLAAFGIIYFVWGSTFLAIRVGVHAVPPLLFAAIRFFTAGLVLVAWTAIRREPWPKAREWGSICLLAALIFVGDYGLLFWAETEGAVGHCGRDAGDDSGVHCYRGGSCCCAQQRLTLQLGAALVIGLAGVAVLMSRSFNLGGAPISTVGAVALIVAAMFWSVASVMTRRLPLPSSKVLSSGAQMLAGGVMLAVVAAGVWRAAKVSCGGGVGAGVVCAGVSDCDGFDRWIHVAMFG